MRCRPPSLNRTGLQDAVAAPDQVLVSGVVLSKPNACPPISHCAALPFTRNARIDALAEKHQLGPVHATRCSLKRGFPAPLHQLPVQDLRIVSHVSDLDRVIERHVHGVADVEGHAHSAKLPLLQGPMDTSNAPV